VRPASIPSLASFIQQKTVVLTTFRRSSVPVPTPVSIAVDGDRAVVRSFARAGKTRRLRRDPTVRVAPCTFRGTPIRPGIDATARPLHGADARAAASTRCCTACSSRWPTGSDARGPAAPCTSSC
jgi:PPOX class probable F420-dependent enzyme